MPFVIAANLLFSDGKKIIIVSHFLKQESFTTKK